MPLTFGLAFSAGRQHCVSLYGTAASVTLSASFLLPLNPARMTTTGCCSTPGSVDGTLLSVIVNTCPGRNPASVLKPVISVCSARKRSWSSRAQKFPVSAAGSNASPVSRWRGL